MHKNFKNMAIIFIGTFFLSLFSNTLSPFITTIRSTYNVSNSVISMLPSVVYCASFIMSLIGAKIIIKLGLKKSLYCGLLLLILSSIIIIFSTSFYILLIAYFISGLALGLSGLSLVTLLSLLPKKYQKYGLYNACFGLGGILIQPIDRFILKSGINFSYTYIFHMLTVCIFIFLATKLEEVSIIKFGSKETKFISVISNPFTLMLCIAIFFYVGAEISTTNWTGNFLEKYYGLSKLDVPGILLGFWILFTIGRTLSDILLEKIGQLKFLSISPIISILGVLIMLLGNTKLHAIIGISIIGITISAIYPAIQGYIMQHISKEQIPSTSAAMSMFNNLGATLLTYIIGFAGGIKITYVFIIQIFFYLYIALVSARYLLFKQKNIHD
ncbi:MFS transporter [Clostridium guangxiense]|uniref:MFS transporter n=1 Tax=Clostridium guangxiense TaxID=1662055 RepID=UPI001E512729|nr:MFS transporter [Clostridium guangxiense]MCD2345454.1 MFS transporter [Clostridium guangxiense]